MLSSYHESKFGLDPEAPVAHIYPRVELFYALTIVVIAINHTNWSYK